MEYIDININICIYVFRSIENIDFNYNRCDYYYICDSHFFPHSQLCSIYRSFIFSLGFCPLENDYVSKMSKVLKSFRLLQHYLIFSHEHLIGS